MSKLRFSVVACTSEDVNFRATELNANAVNSKGYMTAKNCPYPQELVLQLQDGLCRLTQVQLLSHQSCITTKIELFVSQTLLYEGDTTKFSRLGFLTLKANTETGRAINFLQFLKQQMRIDMEARTAITAVKYLFKGFDRNDNLWSALLKKERERK
ncbi:Component of synaptic membrane glycine-, glutamate-and thienylcyclohexylpiperidine-binding glycoprotein (43kDa) [Plasmopara halstedii]|uniref:Component of synaptic membrane glycine-, glutamate-and thienylcyclohexylpiperidine-binding glycoprotein (43kDa) n=1 Tax=Plasmopara halstedii TaxID=4781 RepID=A0A0P1ANV1_PLAHL|nr:Component of synaptic membrane glycine-, glutamate-and thienylcyclohexylpiperidine-binding glycoprotein (43kDa) [Plasmopara halstedii]CEG42828.1 Component of synaptic membrane glycine-, glutamate-and thienylcyclohexylpiperidine-binding glycoprotein (43kDa) [Plasmopara halstedii]|eukprot:XP_024579197.1 Component of synaptic membrane glycine-, glutamate-and thienylcyclohexylpiperidine-binding glycoprotein (43kDa) [Plasmopara halstedii]